VRVDAKCSYAGDTTIAEVQIELETTWAEAGFRAYTPQVTLTDPHALTQTLTQPLTLPKTKTKTKTLPKP